MWCRGSLEVGTYELQFLAIPYYRDENNNFQQLTSGFVAVNEKLRNYYKNI